MRLLLVLVLLLSSVARVRGQALCPEPGCTPIYSAGLFLRETVAPGTPPPNQDILYATSGQVCSKNSSGTVTCMGTGGGGGASTFDQLGSGNNTGATMQCTGACAMTGNITAAQLAGLPFNCTSPTVANSIAPNGNLGCTQVSIPMLAVGTSAQLFGVISDATGTGGPLVFQTGPTLASPALTGTPIFTGLSKYTVQGSSPAGPASGSIFVYAKSNQLCSMNSAGTETCGLGASTGNVTGPGPTVTANAVATFNGTGGLTIQASPCTIDATGLEDCPAPTGTTQGALIIKQGQGYSPPAYTWALTLGTGALANNFVCQIDVATGGLPSTCLDTVAISSGGTGQTTKQAAFDALSPNAAKGDLTVYNGTHNVNFTAGANGTCLSYDSTQPNGVKAVVCGGSLPGVQTASTSSWSCTAATGGLFLDTDCNVLCDCNPVALKFCRSDTGACLSATDCCSATTTTSTTSTTTTTTNPHATDWTSSFLAVWLFEEATGGPWLSQVGGTTRSFLDASASTFHVAKDTTNFVQGTASANAADTTHYEIYTGNASGDTIENPTLTVGMSWGCWAKATMNDSSGTQAGLFGSFGTAGNGAWGIEEIDSSPRWRAMVGNASSTAYADPGAADGTTRGAFGHVVGTWANGGAGSDTIRVYVNGAQTASATGTAGTRNFTSPNRYVTGFQIEGGGDRNASGNLDECFIYQGILTAGDVCRICRCGIDGTLCTCSGTSYSGTNATRDGMCKTGGTTCDMSAVACNASTP